MVVFEMVVIIVAIAIGADLIKHLSNRKHVRRNELEAIRNELSEIRQSIDEMKGFIADLYIDQHK